LAKEPKGPQVTDHGLTCREVLDVVTDYLEGVLSPMEHARVAAHLQECPPCTRYLEQFTATIEATAALREEAVPDDVRESLLAAFRTWRQPGA
jgi:predicted anti-sigma-YlaC factor YlaD